MLSMFRPSGLSGTPAGVSLVFVILSLLLLPILLAAVLWYTQRHDEQVTRKIFWAAFTVQLIVAIGAVYYYAVSPVVRHLGQPVDVKERYHAKEVVCSLWMDLSTTLLCACWCFSFF
jgi:hypothetical protein